MTISRVAVIGCGSIGSRHARNLVQLGATDLIFCDRDIKRAESLAGELKGSGDFHTVTELEDALALKPEAAVIATPTSTHLKIALRIAEHGVHVLVEKPLSHNLEGIETLRAKVAETGARLMMAMSYRFHKGLQEVAETVRNQTIGRVLHVTYLSGQYLPDWHPAADYRIEYAARRDLGGGVILTSGIHGLDNIRWMFGEVSSVAAVYSSLGDLEIDVEDYTAAILKLQDGTPVIYQADFLRRKPEHRMTVIGTTGRIEADFIQGVIEIEVAGQAVEKITPAFQTAQMYVDEMREFLSCISEGRAPSVDLEEGIESLRLTLTLKESFDSRTTVDLPRKY